MSFVRLRIYPMSYKSGPAFFGQAQFAVSLHAASTYLPLPPGSGICPCLIVSALGCAWLRRIKGHWFSNIGRFCDGCFASARSICYWHESSQSRRLDRVDAKVRMTVPPIRGIMGSLTDEPSEARESTLDLALQATPAPTGLPGDVAERLKAAVC